MNFKRELLVWINPIGSFKTNSLVDRVSNSFVDFAMAYSNLTDGKFGEEMRRLLEKPRSERFKEAPSGLISRNTKELRAAYKAWKNIPGAEGFAIADANLTPWFYRVISFRVMNHRQEDDHSLPPIMKKLRND